MPTGIPTDPGKAAWLPIIGM
jgi:ubiquinone/menaquinone biosynthesis C-methylase UbiE